MPLALPAVLLPGNRMEVCPGGNGWWFTHALQSISSNKSHPKSGNPSTLTQHWTQPNRGLDNPCATSFLNCSRRACLSRAILWLVNVIEQPCHLEVCQEWSPSYLIRIVRSQLKIPKEAGMVIAPMVDISHGLGPTPMYLSGCSLPPVLPTDKEACDQCHHHL